jgi:hypothetical protein
MGDDLVKAEACAGFSVSPDGSRFRLRLARSGTVDCVVELPVAGLASLVRTLPEIQQVALPRALGDGSLRVMRDPIAWSIERDMTDESLVLVLVTDEGYEWCFQLADAEIFKMASFLKDERMTTLPPPGLRQ